MPTVPRVLGGPNDFFADDLRRHGDRVALVTATETVTYLDLERRVAALARRLGGRRRLVHLGVANAVAFETIVLQNEGFERDEAVVEQAEF